MNQTAASLPALAPGLYLVGTPIGNLEDMTLRGLRVLGSADRIACEDTRQTQKLLNHFGITTPTTSLHEHNEAERTPEMLAALRAGARIALVTDAGMPGIADPGMHLARAAIEAGIAVYPVPGANALLTAIVASGLDTRRFVFAGFLPSKAGERRTALEGWRKQITEPLTLAFYETPHRILEALSDFAAIWGDQVRVVLARELTKLHEEFLRGTVAEVRSALGERDRMRGEMVLLIEAQPATAAAPATTSIVERLAELAASEGLDEKDALKRIARERSLAKSEVYRELQRERARR